MTRNIPLIARDLKKLYTGFLILCVVLFAVCTVRVNPKFCVNSICGSNRAK